MKLLFDQNLSPRLIELLSSFYPNSEHVQLVGLAQAQDSDVWKYARQNNLIIVSKDADFSELSMAHGFPPKIIWIRRGNCATREIETILLKDYDQIKEFVSQETKGILLLF